MAISRIKVWQQGEILTAVALNTEFDNVLNGVNALDDVSTSTVTSTTGTQARTLADRFDTVFNVLDYGSTPNAGALQAAIDAAEANGGGAVMIPANTTVNVGTTIITVGDNITLFGYGDTSIINATGAGRTGTDYIIRNDTVGSGNSNITIRNLRINGDRPTQTAEIHGIHLENVTNGLVEGCRFVDHAAAVWLRSCINCRVTGNVFDKVSANRSGVITDVDVNVCERITIDHNRFGESDIEAIDINGGCHTLVIDANQMHRCGTNADGESIDILDGTGMDIKDFIVSNNVINCDGVVDSAIRIGMRAERGVIIGNTMIDGNDPGSGFNARAIGIGNSNRLAIIGNTIEGFRYGILFQDLSDTATTEGVSIIGNTIRGTGLEAIDLNGSATLIRSVNVIGNFLDGLTTSAEAAINVQKTFGFYAIGNEIWDFIGNGIIVQTSEKAIVCDNNVRSCANGIWVQVPKSIVNGNIVTDNANNGILIDEADMNVVGNTCLDNTFDGIRFNSTAADRAIVMCNRARLNGGNGIDVANAVTDVIISYNILTGNTGANLNNSGNAGGASIVGNNIT